MLHIMIYSTFLSISTQEGSWSMDSLLNPSGSRFWEESVFIFIVNEF